jgi:hypothetical protein
MRDIAATAAAHLYFLERRISPFQYEHFGSRMRFRTRYCGKKTSGAPADDGYFHGAKITENLRVDSEFSLRFK